MDSATTRQLGDLLREHREQIVKRWTAGIVMTLRGRLSDQELSRQVEELFGAVRDATQPGEELTVDAAGAAELRAVLSELSRKQARQGFNSTETAVAVFGLKEALLEVVDTADPQALRTFVSFSQFVDEMGLYTFEAYTKSREELIAGQAEQLLELSTPVVKLWDGVVAVPLVGTLDSARAQVVMERLLQTLVDTGSPYAIIDITGVPAVDTQVAQHVLKTVVAARLMGADCIISGIRPQIAQTIVGLGIEFGDIVTKASLADALMHALRSGGMDLSRRADRRG